MKPHNATTCPTCAAQAARRLLERLSAAQEAPRPPARRPDPFYPSGTSW